MPADEGEQNESGGRGQREGRSLVSRLMRSLEQAAESDFACPATYVVRATRQPRSVKRTRPQRSRFVASYHLRPGRRARGSTATSRRVGTWLIAAGAAVVLLLAAGPTGAAATATPGAAGLGDRLNPGIGNGGYDVLGYDLSLRYATSDPAGSAARATRRSSRAPPRRFRSSTSTSVASGVGGRVRERRAATFKRKARGADRHAGEPDRQRSTFTVIDHRLHGDPDKDHAATSTRCVLRQPDGSAIGAAALRRPPGLSVQRPPPRQGDLHVHDRRPAGRTRSQTASRPATPRADGRTIWTYGMTQPMATELTQIAVGNWDFSAPPAARRRRDPRRHRPERHGSDAARSRADRASSTR